MNNTVKRLALTACTLLAITSCGNDTSTDTGQNAPELPPANGTPAASTTQVQQQTNERGFIVKQLGETACFGGADKNCEGGVSFAIDKVEVDPPCSEFGSQPEGGHTLLLHLRIATGSDANVVDRVVTCISHVMHGSTGRTRRSPVCCWPTVSC